MKNVILSQLRSDLEGASTSSWDNIQRWIDRAGPVIQQHFPQYIQQLQSIAVRPPTPDSIGVFPGGNTEDYLEYIKSLSEANSLQEQRNNAEVKQGILELLKKMSE